MAIFYGRKLKTVWTLTCILLVISMFSACSRSENQLVAGFDVTGSELEDEYFIKELIEQKVVLHGLDFDHLYSMSYTEKGAQLTGVYLTQTSIEALRTHYTGVIEDVDDLKPNSASELHITGRVDGMPVEIRNYFSEVTNVITVVFDIDRALVDHYAEATEAAFPDTLLDEVEGAAALCEGELFGGYVMYTFDSLDPYGYVGVPKISKAFAPSTERDFHAFAVSLEEGYGKVSYMEEQKSVYVESGGYLYMFAESQSGEGEPLMIATLQKLPENE